MKSLNYIVGVGIVALSVVGLSAIGCGTVPETGGSEGEPIGPSGVVLDPQSDSETVPIPPDSRDAGIQRVCYYCTKDADCCGGNRECMITTCDQGVCKTVPSTTGTPCGPGIPSMQCDGAGICGIYVPPSCDTPIPPPGQPTCPLCDDGNECTFDSCTDQNVCVNQYYGAGTPCHNGTKACKAGFCCAP